MRILNQEWEDSLVGERYPFAGTGPIVSDAGFTLPFDTIRDCNIMVDQQTETVLLASIQGGAIPVATFTLEDGTLVGTAELGGSMLSPIELGNLVVGFVRHDPLLLPLLAAPTLHRFTDLALLPHLLVVSDKRWRQGFELPDGTVLTGDVILVADRECWLERTMTGFRLHVTGDPFAGRTAPARGLKTLSGAVPDADGNVNLIGVGVGNYVGPIFSAAGQPFRISLIPGQGTLRIELVGGGDG